MKDSSPGFSEFENSDQDFDTLSKKETQDVNTVRYCRVSLKERRRRRRMQRMNMARKAIESRMQTKI